MLRTPSIVLALALAVSLVAAQPAPAQEQRREDGLSKLWRTYPLEQTTMLERGESSSAGPDASDRPLPPEEASPTSA
jgi:hypothetical protein